MKHTLLLIFLLIIASLNTYSEQPAGQKDQKCGFVSHSEFLKASDPTLQQRLVEDEISLQKSIQQSSQNRISNAVYNIPVVVHVVYKTSTQNISDQQIQSQIDVLNEDFARLNADTTNTPTVWSNIASGTRFRFCLAQRDPSGNPTTGIERRMTTVTTFYTDDKVKAYSTGGLNPWNTELYFNIWVCKLGNQILGYGEFPTQQASNTYGAVISYRAFGNNGAVQPPYDLGRTTTHEVGHCFNLYHIWGDDDGCVSGPCCGGSDQVGDTPNQEEATYGCKSFPFNDNCSVAVPGVMFMNYMDYTDDNCMNMFTTSQVTRMETAMIMWKSSLLNSTACMTSTGIVSKDNFQFNIYPNPSSGIFTLDLFQSKNIGNKANVLIIDALGKTVKEFSVDPSNSYNHTIDLSTFSEGVYFIRVYNDIFRKTERIVLTR